MMVARGSIALRDIDLARTAHAAGLASDVDRCGMAYCISVTWNTIESGFTVLQAAAVLL
jgi:hypothetical protein